MSIVTTVNKEQIIQTIDQYEIQKEKLIELVLIRNNGIFDEELYYTYLNEGIFYSETLDDFAEIMIESGVDLDEFDFEPTDILTKGYLIPVYDHLGDVLYFINYNSERGKNKKYFIAYPYEYKDKVANIRVIGLDGIKEALEEQVIFITEGTFDRLRLKAYGLPVISTMGTQLTGYFKEYIKRFKHVVYIGDNDSSGKRSFRLGFKQGMNVYQEIVPVGKDVDEYAILRPQEFSKWVDKELKKHILR